jgi:hypothetical protein
MLIYEPVLVFQDNRFTKSKIRAQASAGSKTHSVFKITFCSLGNIILVAHKCLDYDAKVLLRNLEEFEIPYEEIILGFSDSLLASR